MDLVAGAVGSIVTKLGELLHEEYKLQKGLKEQIEYLEKELVSAHAALCKVGDTLPEHQDRQVRLWAGDVREASYDMEDILDAFLVDVMEGAAPDETKSKKGLLKRLKEMTKLLKKSKARHDIDGAIKDMKRRLQEVWDRRERYSIPVAVAAPATRLDHRLVDMHREAAQIIGIKRTRAELIAKLQSSTHSHGDAGASSSSNLTKIVSVVGAGGLGKTTLAKAVYDELSTTGYDCRAFVSVGRNPDLVQVFTSIIFGLDQNIYQAIRDIKDLQLLIGELRKFLDDKRFFIVIDDVWDINSWQALGSALHQNNHVSRVVKTTRNLEVACGDELYQLGPLSHDNSKKLFYMRLYGGEDKCPAHHPEEASEKILHKCGGVPLAIITMASLLVGKSRQDWIEGCNYPGFYGGRDSRQVDATEWILSLSYHDLPAHLKTCLLYLSVYPEDYVIEKDSLIWKWVAEGFIEKKTGTSLFQLGEEYFHQLINRSMIQATESEYNGIIHGCRVHDMVLDLIRGLANEENLITISNDRGTSSRHKVRRLAHQNRILLLGQSHLDSHRDMAQLRSLVAHQCDIRGWVLHPSLKLLRVLALEGCTSSDQSESDWHGLEHIGKLVHLRYLGLPYTIVEELPEAIGALKLLQTLHLAGMGGYNREIQLPSSISQLSRLVCLRCDLSIRVPDEFLQKMTSLEELKISIGMLSFESWRLFLKELGNLSRLRVLHVFGMGSMDEGMQAELLKSLGNLQELQNLVLFGKMDEAALEWDKAVFSEHLRILDLRIIWFPYLSSFINPTLVPNLCYLWLCVGHMDEAGLRALGELTHLGFLCIVAAYFGTASNKQAAVVNIAAHDVFFPKLRILSLDSWMVQLVTNDDSTSASLSIWTEGQDPMVFDSKAQDGGRSRVAPAPVVMPNLHKLEFTVPVRAFYNDGHATCDNNLGLDLECLPSLQFVEAWLNGTDAFPDDVNKAEAELRRLAQLHPNSSALRLHVIKIRENNMALPTHGDDEENYIYNTIHANFNEDVSEGGEMAEEVSAAYSLSGGEEENEVSAAFHPDKEEADEVNEEVVSALHSHGV